MIAELEGHVLDAGDLPARFLGCAVAIIEAGEKLNDQQRVEVGDPA